MSRNDWKPRMETAVQALVLLVAASLAIASAARKHSKSGQLIAQGESFHSLTAITETLKDSYHAVVTPQGNALLFTSGKDGNPDIYLKTQLTGPAVRKLTTHGAQDIQPTVSPAGDQVAFASRRSGNYDIFVLSLAGGSAKQQITESQEDELWPSWSPDGRRIAYARYSRIDGQWYVWIKELDTGANIQLGPGRDPSFSPDGQQLLFEKPSQTGARWYSLWTMTLNGSKVTQITSGDDWGAVDGGWSPDGRKLIFTSSKGISGKVLRPAEGQSLSFDDIALYTKDSNLWVVNADGTGLTQMTTHDSDDSQAHWSIDNFVYFTSDRDGERRIWRFRPTFPDAYHPSTWTPPPSASVPIPAKNPGLVPAIPVPATRSVPTIAPPAVNRVPPVPDLNRAIPQRAMKALSGAQPEIPAVEVPAIEVPKIPKPPKIPSKDALMKKIPTPSFP